MGVRDVAHWTAAIDKKRVEVPATCDEPTPPTL